MCPTSQIWMMVLVLACSAPAHSYQPYCKTEEFAKTKLRVTVPAERLASFIDYLESEKEPLTPRARYVGGAEDSDSKSFGYLITSDKKPDSRIDISINYKKSAREFDVYFMSCNTHASLKPYLVAVRNRLNQFGGLTIVEMRSEPRDRFGPLE